MRILRWLLGLFLPRANMSIQNELNQIFQTLRVIQGNLDTAADSIDDIEVVGNQTAETVRTNHELLNQLIATQIQHGQLLRHILETIIGPPAAKVIFTIKVGNTITEGATKVKIKDNQEFDVALSFQDAAGNAASVQGAPTWTVDNTAALTVTPSDDGLSAVVSAVGPTGTGQVSVSADADLGEGTTTITGVLDVEVIAGDATLIVLNPGPARDKAAPAPPTPPTA
jgi:hypothetical protein